MEAKIFDWELENVKSATKENKDFRMPCEDGKGIVRETFVTENGKFTFFDENKDYFSDRSDPYKSLEEERKNFERYRFDETNVNQREDIYSEIQELFGKRAHIEYCYDVSTSISNGDDSQALYYYVDGTPSKCIVIDGIAYQVRKDSFNAADNFQLFWGQYPKFMGVSHIYADAREKVGKAPNRFKKVTVKVIERWIEYLKEVKETAESLINNKEDNMEKYSKEFKKIVGKELVKGQTYYDSIDDQFRMKAELDKDNVPTYVIQVAWGTSFRSFGKDDLKKAWAMTKDLNKVMKRYSTK